MLALVLDVGISANKRYECKGSGYKKRIFAIAGVRLVEMNQIVKKQHFVWRHYLGSWAVDGKLYCLRQKTGRVDPASPRSVGVERFTYASQKLSEGDILYFKVLLSGFASEYLKENAKRLIALYQTPHKMREVLQRSRHAPAALMQQAKEELNFSEKMMGEKFHSLIEGRAVKTLRRLKEKDASMMDEGTPIELVFFLCNQYFRTRKMLNNRPFVANQVVSGHDPSRTALLESVIWASNVAAGLAVEHRRYKLVFIVNTSEIPFVTGDQPIINLFDVKGGPRGDAIKFYYPLSPSLSMLFVEKLDEAKDIILAGEIEVSTYNYLMLEAADQEMYANDAKYLSELGSLRTRFLSSL